ncbi:MAG: polyphenol oxidase family protein [Ilumatobacteraceae bacterium]
MLELIRREVSGRVAVVAVSERADGDVHPIEVTADVLDARQRSLTGRPWTMTDQVHGVECLTVDDREPWANVAGVADVVVVPDPSRPVAVWAADCAPLVLIDSAASVIVGVHAGWRGLAGGVIDVGVDAIEQRGGAVDLAVLGPSIHACCYEFGRRDLEAVAAGVGADPDELSSVRDGRLALDTSNAVRAGLRRRGVALDAAGPCTGCDTRWFSHRRRADPERHAIVAWFEDRS